MTTLPTSCSLLFALIAKRLTAKRVLLLLAALSLTMTFLPFHSFSFILLDAVQEFQADRGPIAGPVALYWLTLAIVSPFVGHAIGRFGIAWVWGGGSVILALGLLLASRAPSLIVFYLMFGIVVSIGAGAIGPVTTFALVQRVFTRQLGTAMGIVSTGMAGGLILAPVIQYSVHQWGWRETYVLLTLCTLVIMIPIALYVGLQLKRMAPEHTSELLIKGNVARQKEASERFDPTPVERNTSPRQRALRTLAFWYLFAAGFLGPFAFQGPLVHQVAFLTQVGYSPQVAGVVASAIGLMSIGSRLSAGMIADRMGRRRAYALSSCAGAISLLLLFLGSAYWIIVVLYAALFGFSYAAFAPLFPAASAELFGGSDYAAIHGMLYVGLGVGAALGAWLPGFVYDLTDHYHVSLVLGAIALIFSGFCYARAKLPVESLAIATVEGYLCE